MANRARVLLVATGLVVAAGCAAPPADDRPVLVVAIDGLTWDVVDPLVEAGRMPNLAALAERGARGTVVAEEPLISPVLWTTVATGRPPAEHGVDDFLHGGVPVSGELRRAPAIWNMVSDRGRTVGVSGWYVTWPAEEVRGFLLSDRLLMRGVEQTYFPAELAEAVDLKSRWNAWAPSQAWRLERFTSFAFDPAAGAETPTRGAPPERIAQFLLTRRLAMPYARDATFADLAVTLQAAWKPDLHIVYLVGSDYVSHGFWRYAFPDQFNDPPPEGWEQLAEIIPRYHEYMDEVLGELVAAAGPEATVLVISDHGFGPAVPGHMPPPAYWYLSGSHRPDGLMVLAGPVVRDGAALDGPDHLDVVPNLLTLLDLPIGEEMPGRVWREALRPEVVRRARVDGRYDDGWEWRAAPTRTAADEEILAGLRALGYIPPEGEDGPELLDEGFESGSVGGWTASER